MLQGSELCHSLYRSLYRSLCRTVHRKVPCRLVLGSACTVVPTYLPMYLSLYHDPCGLKFDGTGGYRELLGYIANHFGLSTTLVWLSLRCPPNLPATRTNQNNCTDGPNKNCMNYVLFPAVSRNYICHQSWNTQNSGSRLRRDLASSSICPVEGTCTGSSGGSPSPCD